MNEAFKSASHTKLMVAGGAGSLFTDEEIPTATNPTKQLVEIKRRALPPKNVEGPFSLSAN
ncbi:hypothetical protein ABE28_012605 [Peribacillus muralis]|uniref:Uncharacterized protein n=1 Tax=Peribacillus muralis TaxID=264697 RepID=A0A1B3XPP7_9BACI|nr:hypothetical protein ABE28_012605 [Peribacillus muralis]